MSSSFRQRLRLGRTLFVHRWHAAQTIGERFGNDAVGERFEHINHARSLAQYVWRFGPFGEEADGSGRIAVAGDSLEAVVAPVAKKGRRRLEAVVRHAAALGRDASTDAGEVGADVHDCATRLLALHRAMLPYYVEMRYLTPDQAGKLRRGPVPLLGPLLARNGRLREAIPASELAADLDAAVRRAFALNIYNALACRARAELFETLVRNHPRGTDVATVATGRTSRFVVAAGALVNGAHRQFVICDRALARMLQSIDEPPFPAVIRWLAAFKTFVSATITTMPVFIVKNFFRDTLAGFVAGRYFQWPFLGTLAGGCHAFYDMAGGRSSAMREYLLQGGFYSGLVESETDLGPARKEGGALRHAAAVRQKWARLVHVATRPAWLAEAGTRVNQFQRARRAGATNYAAARAARMVSSDFANIGASRSWRMYVHTVPFLNAAIQGIDQLYQVVRWRFRADPSAPKWNPEQRRHFHKAVLTGLCLAGASGAAWKYNTSDPLREAAYKAETEYDKASWVTLYDFVGDADVRIPVPFQIGAAFVKVPEIAFDLATGTETLAGLRYAWSLLHGNLWMGWKPAVVQPVIEIYTNRNFFGSEIIPSYMKNWPSESQFFRRSTPLPYRHAGEWLGVSPLHVQTVWRGWTGHMGNIAVVFLDERLWDQTANGPKPFPRTMRLLTGLYSLQAPVPRTYTRYGNEFYDIADWADANVRGKNCRNASSLSLETASACRANTATNRMARHASRLRSAGDDVRTDSTRTRAAKEAELIAIYEEIDAIFREVLPEIRELRRRGGG